GVGMDVVRTNVRRLNGDVEVRSVVGEGTRFTLRLPLTLLVSEALIVTVAEERLAVPLNAVQLVTRVRLEDVRPGPRGEAILVGEDLVDLVPLPTILGLERGPRRPRRPVLVVRGAGRTLAVEVDEILHKQEIVIKPLGEFLTGVGPYGGASVGADARVTLLLDPGALVDDVRRRPATRSLPVIALTTRAGDKHVALAKSLGVQHYVTKPVEEHAFVTLVASLVPA